MIWVGKKIKYKAGRGEAIGTVVAEYGDRVIIRTQNDKDITRGLDKVLGEVFEEPDDAPDDRSDIQMFGF